MKALLCTAICLTSVTCFGQTKLISHRSHSGTNANFRLAVEGDLFNINRSNFGIVNPYYNDIDTVARLSGNKIIVSRQTYYSLVKGKPYHPVSIKDTLNKTNAAIFFKADNIDSLKADLHKKYPVYKLDKTTFIGFDKKFKQNKD